MNKEEEKLLGLYGKENPFRVPEGYFDTLPQQVMTRISCRKKRRSTWKWMEVAAALVGLVFVVGVNLYVDEQFHQTAENAEVYTEDELDYLLISNQDIKVYLSEAE